LVTTRKKNWRLDGQDPDRQRDWLGVSNIGVYPICSETGAVDSTVVPQTARGWIVAIEIPALRIDAA
jgi:hypothetical protein